MLFYILLLLLFQHILCFHNKITFTSFLQKKIYENNENEEILNLLYTIQKSGFHISKLLSYSHIENLNGYFKKDNVNVRNNHHKKERKIDILSNGIIKSNIEAHKGVHVLTSEEDKEKRIKLKNNKKIIVVYDPLDGSNNIDTNMPRATIFGCYYDSLDCQNNLESINSQHNLVLSGYILYSSSINLVFFYENKVYHFVYDDLIKDFVIINDNVKMPNKGKVYSINEAKINTFHRKHKLYLDKLKEEDYSLRYSGCLVADVHNLIIHGGIYMYPKNIKSNESKLRLLYEAKPLSRIIECVGGMCVDEYRSIQFKDIKDIHEKTPLYIGSKENIIEFNKFCYKVD